MVDEKVIYCCAGTYTCLAFALAIAAASWMTHQVNTESWKDELVGFNSADMAVINSVRKSWDSNPFVDVRLIDTTTEGSYCPTSHPNDVIEEIWMGT